MRPSLRKAEYGQLVSDLRVFPLPWSHYVLLVSRTRSSEALDFYHAEALRGGCEPDEALAA